MVDARPHGHRGHRRGNDTVAIIAAAGAIAVPVLTTLIQSCSRQPAYIVANPAPRVPTTIIAPVPEQTMVVPAPQVINYNYGYYTPPRYRPVVYRGPYYVSRPRPYPVPPRGIYKHPRPNHR